jgi:succinyl-diaminopimelate desuccinylase
MTNFLDLSRDVAELTADLIDIPSVSGYEKNIADVIEESLKRQPHLSVVRFGDSIVARTELGRSERSSWQGILTLCHFPALQRHAERSQVVGRERAFTDAAPRI